MLTLRTVIFCAGMILLAGCETAYYNAWEKVGVHKRDIVVDRIEDTQKAQEDTQEQFKDALEQYRAVVSFDGGNLEKLYYRLNDEFEASEAAAKKTGDRIDSVEDVADDLFSEWQDELALYKDQRLRRDSEAKLRRTRDQFSQLIKTMRKSEKSVHPVLDTLRDQTLYLKHNLNAQAIASLKSELTKVDADVARLVADMQKSINEANKFIKSIKG